MMFTSQWQHRNGSGG